MTSTARLRWILCTANQTGCEISDRDLRDCQTSLATQTTIHSDMANSEVVLKKSGPEDILSSLL